MCFVADARCEKLGLLKLMRPSLSLRLLAVCLPLSSCRTPAPKTPDKPLPTVARVNPARYAGTWHEVARLPNPFQKNCLKSTAHYSVNRDGTIAVVNSCAEKGGSVHSVEGTAEPVPGSRNTRLRVKFKGLAALAPVPDEGNYWVIGLDPGYQWAMVGTPDRKFLWFLSRKPQLPYYTYRSLKARAEELGFDTSKLIPEEKTPSGVRAPAPQPATPVPPR